MKVVPIVSKSILTQMTWAIQLANERLEAQTNNLTARQIAVLQAVAVNPACNQTSLVIATGMDRSTMADIVRRMVERGLLARKRTEEDARSYAVTLTAAGQKAAQSAAGPVSDVDMWLMERITAADRAAVKRWLGGIAEIQPAHLKAIQKAA